MRVLSLASGSSGNAYLVLTDTAKVLIDAGVGVMALRRALQTNGLNATELDAVFITHEHYDHVRGLCRLIRGCSPPVYGTEATLRRLELPWNQAEPVLPEQTVTVGDLKVTPFAVPHDGVAPVGYFLEDDSCRAMLATDLGYVPEQLLPLMSTADLLVLEANHDLHWLNRGPYPRFLKERVASDHGHLSNDQTWRCLLRLPNLPQQEVWLAHLSATNNSPQQALRCVTMNLDRHGLDGIDIKVAERDRPSLSWCSSKPYRQSTLL